MLITIKSFLKSSTGFLYLMFTILVIIVLLMNRCQKEEKHTIDIIPPVVSETELAKDIVESVDETISESIKNDTITESIAAETVKKLYTYKEETMKDDKLSIDEKSKSIAIEQIESIHDLYNQYYTSETTKGTVV